MLNMEISSLLQSKKHQLCWCFLLCIQIHCPGSYLLLPRKTIIGSTGLNFSVRNGKRCDPCDKPPRRWIRIRTFFFMISRFPNRNRAISTSQLNILLRFHLMPINVIISHGPQMMTNLGTGFPLRCFQWLSIPNIATGRSSWR